MSCTLIFFKKLGKKLKITTCHMLFIPCFREYFSKNWILTRQSINWNTYKSFIYLFIYYFCGDIPSFILHMWMLLIYAYNFQIFSSEKNASISHLLIHLFYDQFKALNRIMHGWRRRTWMNSEFIFKISSQIHALIQIYPKPQSYIMSTWTT